MLNVPAQAIEGTIQMLFQNNSKQLSLVAMAHLVRADGAQTVLGRCLAL